MSSPLQTCTRFLNPLRYSDNFWQSASDQTKAHNFRFNRNWNRKTQAPIRKSCNPRLVQRLYWPVEENTANRVEVLQIFREWSSIYRNVKHHLYGMFSPGVRPPTLRSLKLPSSWRCNLKTLKISKVRKKRFKKSVSSQHAPIKSKLIPFAGPVCSFWPHEHLHAGWAASPRPERTLLQFLTSITDTEQWTVQHQRLLFNRRRNPSELFLSFECFSRPAERNLSQRSSWQVE